MTHFVASEGKVSIFVNDVFVGGYYFGNAGFGAVIKAAKVMFRIGVPFDYQ